MSASLTIFSHIGDENRGQGSRRPTQPAAGTVRSRHTRSTCKGRSSAASIDRFVVAISRFEICIRDRCESRLARIDQRKQYATRLRAAIDPSMIGRLLDDDIACPHVHHRVVEHHVDLAGQHDGVIDGPRAVHPRETASNLADFHQREGNAHGFAGKGREIGPALRSDRTLPKPTCVARCLRSGAPPLRVT